MHSSVVHIFLSFFCLTSRFSSLPPFQFGCFSCSASFWFVFSFLIFFCPCHIYASEGKAIKLEAYRLFGFFNSWIYLYNFLQNPTVILYLINFFRIQFSMLYFLCKPLPLEVNEFCVASSLFWTALQHNPQHSQHKLWCPSPLKWNSWIIWGLLLPVAETFCSLLTENFKHKFKIWRKTKLLTVSFISVIGRKLIWPPGVW